MILILLPCAAKMTAIIITVRTTAIADIIEKLANEIV